jgi:hypothetical protein
MSDVADIGLASEATNWRAIAIAIALTTVGCIAAGASTLISTAWIQNTALAIATTLVSTGSLSLLFELALRRTVYREMLRLSGISRIVATQQIVSAGKSNLIDWPAVFRAKSQMQFVFLDPSGWIDQHINSLLDNGRQRRIAVEFIFPDPTAGYIDDVARAVGKNPEEYRHSIIGAADRIERSWLDLKGRSALAAKSQITVRLTDHRPLYSMALCDDITVIELTALTGRRGSDVDYFYEHVGDRGAFPSSWYRDQFERLTPLPVRYRDEVY